VSAHASRRILPRLALVALALLAAPSVAAAKDDPKPSKKAAKPPANRAEALSRALRRLDEDVATGERDMNEQHRVFTIAIAGLDFLMDPAAGKGAAHADRVERASEAIGRYVEGAARAFAAPDRLERDEMSAFQWSQTTWALSAATLFYAECAARGRTKAEANAKLKVLADLLARHQQADGGFGHDQKGSPRIPEIPVPTPDGGTRMLRYPATLLSASAWAGFAIGTLRPIGGKRLEPVVTRARDYFRASQSPGGAFPYDPSQKEAGGSDPTAAARTAGGYVALRALGLPPADKAVSRAPDYVSRHVADLPEGHGSSPHGVFFGAIACLWIGPAARAEFERTVVPRILAAQDPQTGAFDCVCRGEHGTTCESFGKPDASPFGDAFDRMGPGVATWRRAYVNALNLFAVLCDKGRPRFLDGVPAAGPTPAPETTPSDPPAMDD
jgi:hypothetical protein